MGILSKGNGSVALFKCGPWTSSVRPSSPGNILAMQILRHHPRGGDQQSVLFTEV